MGKVIIGSKQPSLSYSDQVDPKSLSLVESKKLEKEIVYVDRPMIVEKIVEVEKEVIRYVDREVEVIKHVVQEVEKEVIREVEKIIEKPLEVIRIKFQPVLKYPLWMLGIILTEAIVIAALLLR